MNTARFFSDVDGLLHAVLFVLPDGVLVQGYGGQSHWDHEALVRAGVSCLTAPPIGLPSNTAPFSEFAFARRDHIVVVQRGCAELRLGVTAAFGRAANVGLALRATRDVVRGLETARVLERFGL